MKNWTGLAAAMVALALACVVSVELRNEKRRNIDRISDVYKRIADVEHNLERSISRLNERGSATDRTADEIVRELLRLQSVCVSNKHGVNLKEEL